MWGTASIFMLYTLFLFKFLSSYNTHKCMIFPPDLKFLFCQNSNNIPDLWEHQEHLRKSNKVVIGWR